ncbi:MAG TPA: class I SAM-dependent methyltransferase [Thermoanaerobaculia bacterium]|nr:class I SAM-dependent methyltransferase [Thermoanaerobaculia bacterium]
MSSLRYWRTRLQNGIRKIASGLRPFNESVWPGVHNDLFVAHESLYRFATPWAGGARVLDAGTGTGYGAAVLAGAGARSVLAVDLDPLSIFFARRRFSHSVISFRRAHCERLSLPAGSLDLVFSSNVLEHLEHPEEFLAAAFGALAPGGVAVFAVPPITTEGAMEENRGIHYHRSNLGLSEWARVLSRFGWSVSLYHHRFAGSGPLPDFTSPFPSRLSASDFSFTEGTIDEAYRSCPLTAVFVARQVAA